MKNSNVLLAIVCCVLIGGCCPCLVDQTPGSDGFDFVFCWGSVKDEETARAYAEAGVTDVFASGEKAVAAAKKFGMRPYCGFFPNGPRNQVLRADEQQHFDYINAKDLKGKLPKEELARKTTERQVASRCQFGGEPVVAMDTCPEMIACFLSDTNCVAAKAQMKKTLEANPLAEGIAFDYIGYVNFHSCECDGCKARLAASGKDADTFFREALVEYVNTLVDYAKSLRPGIKVAIHLYPAFRPDPLYGKALKADYIQETVAWYFQWPDEKISDYTRKILSAPHLPGARSVPFVGLNAEQSRALAYKSPERLEAELKLILAAGGRQLAVCNGGDMLKPGYREVFRKYRASRDNHSVPAE